VVSVPPATGLLIGSRLDSSTEKFYHVGSLYDTISASSGGLPTTPIYIGCYDQAGAYEFSSKEVAWSSIGSGLTDTDAGNLYTLVQAFQTSLSRQM